ncbi:MAG: DedA family protein [Actinomycetota bacterium]|nr:DedA family protein [Actinomycetota bacterium]
MAPNPQLPGFLHTLAPYLKGWHAYLAVGGFVALEDFGVPVPGETILIAAAVYAGAQRLSIVAVVLIGILAAIVGDNIGFAIGHFGGRAFALRWGKYVFLTAERLDKAQGFFERHGGKVVTVARFIEGLRQANGIIAGLSDMPWLKFLAFNALGAVLWVGLWTTVGYTAGNHIDAIYHQVVHYELYAIVVAVLIAAALVLRHLFARRRASAN